MTIEDIRISIKVRVQAAESVGKSVVAIALLELLDEIDATIAAENRSAE